MNRAEYAAARFLIMRFSPRIGWNEKPSWISVAARASTLDAALYRAAGLRARGCMVWIAERGKPATNTKPAKA